MNKLTLQSDKFSKQMIVEEKNRILDYLLSGKVEPLRVHLYVKAVQKSLDELTKDPEYQRVVENEIATYGKDNHAFGARFEIRERKSYVFDDDRLKILEARIACLSAEKQAREAFLKTIKEPIIDTGSGEVINPPEIKVSSAIYITFDKE